MLITKIIIKHRITRTLSYRFVDLLGKVPTDDLQHAVTLLNNIIHNRTHKIKKCEFHIVTMEENTGQERIMRKYKCKHCKNTVLRDSKKAWIKSYCDKIGKNVHLIKQKEK